MLAVFASSLNIGAIYGTNTYPVTYQVLEMISETFALFMLIVTTFYAGELVWREREARVAPDARRDAGAELAAAAGQDCSRWSALQALMLFVADAVRHADPGIQRLFRARAGPVPADACS